MATSESWEFLKDEKVPPPPKKGFQTEVVWRNVAVFGVAHLAAVPAFFWWTFFRLSWQTWVWSLFLAVTSALLGILAGAHRHYTHRAYKATLPLRLLIVFWNTVAIQNSVWEWSRDHRQHHKYSDTDADPHNATRGFFFSHVGWLMMKKHPDVIAKGKGIDMSDLESDPLVMFQKRYYVPLVVIFAVAMPIAVPMYFWNESFLVAYMVPFLLRTLMVLNITWMVNSWAHAFGNKPYDKSIRPVQSAVVAVLTFGEGWHNYHHCFPWDYRAAELSLGGYNPTTALIDLFARLGWAYDLRQASDDVVMGRALRTGDGTHHSVTEKTTKTAPQTPLTKLEDTMLRSGVRTWSRG